MFGRMNPDVSCLMMLSLPLTRLRKYFLLKRRAGAFMDEIRFRDLFHAAWHDEAQIYGRQRVMDCFHKGISDHLRVKDVLIADEFDEHVHSNESGGQQEISRAGLPQYPPYVAQVSTPEEPHEYG